MREIRLKLDLKRGTPKERIMSLWPERKVSPEYIESTESVKRSNRKNYQMVMVVQCCEHTIISGNFVTYFSPQYEKLLGPA